MPATQNDLQPPNTARVLPSFSGREQEYHIVLWHMESERLESRYQPQICAIKTASTIRLSFVDGKTPTGVPLMDWASAKWPEWRGSDSDSRRQQINSSRVCTTSWWSGSTQLVHLMASRTRRFAGKSIRVEFTTEDGCTRQPVPDGVQVGPLSQARPAQKSLSTQRIGQSDSSRSQYHSRSAGCSNDVLYRRACNCSSMRSTFVGHHNVLQTMGSKI
mmetsp:Transcript_39628/g.117917  ORF Transcript_39628/g.117917 Transcript_39628/m.117917 type:complete len:217 (-) Transcript_39628:39-689(-)